MSNPIKSIFERAQKLVTMGLDRPPQAYLYLDRPSLNEHYQGITGTARVPGITSETLSASIGAKIPIINWGVGGSLETSFSLSDYYLFESLEPELRKLPVAGSVADLERTLRGFTWLSGRLSWYRSVMEDGKHAGEAVTSYVIESAGVSLLLICREESFSPFAPFFTTNPHLYKMAFEVEVLAYNPGILGQYSPGNLAPMSLALVPTAMIVTDAGRRAEIAEWMKRINKGKIARSYDS
jgi:hypothetical protein